MMKLEDELLLYTDPEPVPPPLDVVAEIETTDGVTREEIVLVFMPLPPISTSVRLEEHVPLVERNRA
jgi:hypothetical protein